MHAVQLRTTPNQEAFRTNTYRAFGEHNLVIEGVFFVFPSKFLEQMVCAELTCGGLIFDQVVPVERHRFTWNDQEYVTVQAKFLGHLCLDVPVGMCPYHEIHCTIKFKTACYQDEESDKLWAVFTHYQAIFSKKDLIIPVACNGDTPNIMVVAHGLIGMWHLYDYNWKYSTGLPLHTFCNQTSDVFLHDAAIPAKLRLKMRSRRRFITNEPSSLRLLSGYH